MSRWERSGQRSLAFSQWHRATFDDHADAMDLDLAGICHQSHCRTPLYFIEETRQSGTKATSMLQQLARKASVPGLLVYYKEENGRACHLEQWDAFMVWPENRRIGDGVRLGAYLQELRSQHRRLWHFMLIWLVT